MDLKVLPFLQATQGVGGLERGRGVQYAPPIDTEGTSGTNPFGGNLVGVNTNIGIGDYQDGLYQCGRKLGGRTIGFA